jgi:hypothetical protein
MPQHQQEQPFNLDSIWWNCNLEHHEANIV